MVLPALGGRPELGGGEGRPLRLRRAGALDGRAEAPRPGPAGPEGCRGVPGRAWSAAASRVGNASSTLLPLRVVLVLSRQPRRPATASRRSDAWVLRCRELVAWRGGGAAGERVCQECQNMCAPAGYADVGMLYATKRYCHECLSCLENNRRFAGFPYLLLRAQPCPAVEHIRADQHSPHAAHLHPAPQALQVPVPR